MIHNRLRCIVILLLVAAQVAFSGSAIGAAPADPPWRIDTPWTTETAIIQFPNDIVVAEVADTAELRERGLGYRDELENGTGMLFVYDSPSTRSFWMKGMRICLDIVWIEQGTIRGADESVCPEPGVSDRDLARYVSQEPVTFVLEVPAGWLDEHGYGVGDQVVITFPESTG